ncbi:cyclase [Candidatus Methylomirabilis lanthanidiphila]|uniref:Cyclase n=1 Tax=Candidatus Methylomirabilis lanthanidiphila TaxID=2211376 RepID=A0A564ZFU1_9BACT|nr:ester cyclase [Candidatus Methylomirabilis lanthanidiphila]VUZ84189.1 cyclase [Candidatus Methylomirabilis lanthanidiphila]
MSIEDNKRLVRRLYEETDKQNFEAMDEFFSPDLVDHDPPPIPDLKPGLEGIKQAFKVFASAYPDGTHVIHDLIAEGDRVVVRVSGTGTQTGEFKGIKPTGKKVEMTGIVIYRIEGGKIVERWAQHNFLGFVMQQLGVISPFGHGSPHPS